MSSTIKSLQTIPVIPSQPIALDTVAPKAAPVVEKALGPSAPRASDELVSPPVSSMLSDPEAYQTFWALGQDWWKQLYDGKFHRHGPEVFDKGLHDGTREPGFYEDALRACKWISEEGLLTACPTVELYKNLHKIACRHFDGKNTLVASDKVGEFVPVWTKQCEGDYVSLFGALPDVEDIRKKFNQSNTYLDYEREIVSFCDYPDPFIRLPYICRGVSKEDLLKNLKEAKAWYPVFIKQYEEKREQLQAYIKQRSLALGLDHSIAIYIPQRFPTLSLNYDCNKIEELNKAAEAIFTQYNEKMAKASSQEEKLRLIADLFQMLEWLHPFPDGQGRTDLILLMKELCKHGFTPAILDDPYVSTFCTLDEWVGYLKRGMEKWQKLAAQKTSERLYIPV